MKGTILIVDDLYPVFKESAEILGYTVTERLGMTRGELLETIRDFNGVVVRTSFKIDKEVMDAAPNLRFIGRAGAGLDNIDVESANSKSIHLINAPEGNADAVGEHALGLILSLMNNFRQADRDIRSGVWDRERNRGYELKGKTVGIIGYGYMGHSLARKLSGFDVKTIAYDKYKTGFSDEYAREVSMEEIIKHCDVLSLHLPLTSETRQLVDAEYLRHFKKPFFFINTARGEIVNNQAVADALQSGKMLGAGLDVMEEEKFPLLDSQQGFQSLKEIQNVIFTPHVAGWTFASYRKISEVLAEKLAKLP